MMKTASGKTMEDTGLAFARDQVRPLSAAIYGVEQYFIGKSLPLVPVDTGALRGSAYAAEPRVEGDHVIGEFGYGGVATKVNPKTLEPSSTYAVYVHENLEAHHKVGQAKYLSTPVEAEEAQIGKMIADRMNGAQEAPQDLSGGQGEV